MSIVSGVQLSRFRLLSLLRFSCFCFHSGFPSSSASVSCFVPASSSFSSSSFPFPIFFLSLSARPMFVFLFPHFLLCFLLSLLLMILLFFRLPPAALPLSAVSAPSLVSFLFLFSFSLFSSSSSSLGFPPSSSFSPSLPILSPAFRSYYFLYVFFSSFLCSSSFVFCFLGSFFLLLFLFLWLFLPSLLLSFCCLFLSPGFSSSSGPFSLPLLLSVSFRFFLFLSFSLCLP